MTRKHLERQKALRNKGIREDAAEQDAKLDAQSEFDAESEIEEQIAVQPKTSKPGWLTPTTPIPPALAPADRMGIVFVERPRCPACNSTKLKTLRSVADQGDGSCKRRTQCKACDHRFDLVLE